MRSQRCCTVGALHNIRIHIIWLRMKFYIFFDEYGLLISLLQYSYFILLLKHSIHVPYNLLFSLLPKYVFNIPQTLHLFLLPKLSQIGFPLLSGQTRQLICLVKNTKQFTNPLLFEQ